MFPYTEKYTESESDIQNNNLLYKIHPKCQNSFEQPECFEIFRKQKTKNRNITFLFYTMHKFHNSYFVLFFFIIVLCFVFLYFYIYYIYTRTVVLSYCCTVVLYGDGTEVDGISDSEHLRRQRTHVWRQASPCASASPMDGANIFGVSKHVYPQ